MLISQTQVDQAVCAFVMQEYLTAQQDQLLYLNAATSSMASMVKVLALKCD